MASNKLKAALASYETWSRTVLPSESVRRYRDSAPEPSAEKRLLDFATANPEAFGNVLRILCLGGSPAVSSKEDAKAAVSEYSSLPEADPETESALPMYLSGLLDRLGRLGLASGERSGYAPVPESFSGGSLAAEPEPGGALDEGLTASDFRIPEGKEGENEGNGWIPVSSGEAPRLFEETWVLGRCFPGDFRYTDGRYLGEGRWATKFDDPANPEFKTLAWKPIERAPEDLELS